MSFPAMAAIEYLRCSCCFNILFDKEKDLEGSNDIQLDWQSSDVSNLTLYSFNPIRPRVCKQFRLNECCRGGSNHIYKQYDESPEGEHTRRKALAKAK